MTTPLEQFLAECRNLVERLDEIDKKVPWQTVEPEWWLDMSELRATARKNIAKYEVDV